ncbi:hypothetical protein MMC17_010083, partial [Xylographa soralifera]|nr:hypothetical protein [Xylographa soralifera]
LLLEKGADVNASRKDGTTALHAASRGGHVKIVQLLRENGATWPDRVYEEKNRYVLEEKSEYDANQDASSQDEYGSDIEDEEMKGEDGSKHNEKERVIHTSSDID